MLKKTLFALALAATSIQASQACDFKTTDTEYVREIVRQHGGYPLSDAQCNFLNQRDLALKVLGDATVLKGVSVSWVGVQLTKPGTGVVSNAFRSTTAINASVASQDMANDMFYDALTEAIRNLDFAKAAGEVDAYLAKGRRR